MASHPQLPEQLTITASTDPWLVEHGHPATGRYVEHYWLPVVGPTGVLLLRQAHFLVGLADGHRATVATSDLAAAIGIGRYAATLARTVARLERFHLAHLDPATCWLHVPTHVAPVPVREHVRLPSWLREPAPDPSTPSIQPAAAEPPAAANGTRIEVCAQTLQPGDVIQIGHRRLAVRTTTREGLRILTELEHLEADRAGNHVDLQWSPDEPVRRLRHEPVGVDTAPGLDI